MSLKKKRIKGELSVKGIRDIQKQLEDYKHNVIIRTRALAEALATKGVPIAKARISTMDAIFEGELINSISADLLANKSYGAVFVVKADSEHAAFVEFGTGQMGAEMPYPYPLPDGLDWRPTPDDKGGWHNKIFQIDEGEYGWLFYKNGEWWFTQGMPSRPFMYETGWELSQIKLVEQTAREVFR